MFGKKIQDDEDSASDCSYNLYNKMGQKNIKEDATKSQNIHVKMLAKTEKIDTVENTIR